MKERDIRPDGFFEEFHKRNDADSKRFFPGGQYREDTPCPACDVEDHEILYEANTFPVVRCRACGSTFVSPRPEEERLMEFYRNATSQKFLAEVWYPQTADKRHEKIYRPRARLILELASTHGLKVDRITDIGAGVGFLLDALREEAPDCTLCGVEPNSSFIAQLSNKGYEVFSGFSTEAGRDPDWKGRADIVTAFEVFEHVHSPYDLVSDMAALVRPGGGVVFTGVNGNGFDILTLGPKANAVCPPQHLNFLSRQGVSRLLERCGLEEVSFSTPGVLDVDIVKNVFEKDPSSVADPFIRYLLEQESQDVRKSFQEFITAKGLSSHMLVVARKPV